MGPKLAPLLVLFLALGCGRKAASSDGGVTDSGASTDAGPTDAGQHAPPDAGPPPLALSSWCQSHAEALCEREIRCLQLAASSKDACVARALGACDQAELAAAVSAGRLGYADQLAGDCVADFQVGCEGEPATCAQVFTGEVGVDGGCLLENECAPGDYCNLYDNACPHQCHAFRNAGEPCNYSDQRCGDTSYCQFGDGGLYCVGRQPEGAFCQSFSDCQAGLACSQNNDTGQGVCIPIYADAGHPCRVDGTYPLCTDGTFCHLVASADGGVCAKQEGLGAVCLGYDACGAGLRCSSTYGTGTCIPLGAVGDPCSGYADCQDELYCAPPTSRCAVLPGDGGDCSYHGSWYRCAPGYYCDFNDERCTPLGELGAPCPYPDTCKSAACGAGTLPDGGFGYVCTASCFSRLDGGF